MESAVVKEHQMPVRTEQDIVQVRRFARDWATQAQFTLTQQTKLMTAASELARNIYRYAKVGTVKLYLITDSNRKGIQMLFEDNGPGIADIKRAMTDGYSTGGSLGMGLSGTKRLVDEFTIDSKVGEGTRIKITLWK